MSRAENGRIVFLPQGRYILVKGNVIVTDSRYGIRVAQIAGRRWPTIFPTVMSWMSGRLHRRSR